MSDVISTAPADVRRWVALDVHKFSIVAAVLPPACGREEVWRIETTEKAIRRFIKTLGGCRDDIRCARTAARHRDAKQLLRHGRIFRDGKTAWTRGRRSWVHRQQLDDPLAHEALAQMLTHLDCLDRQLATLDTQLEHVAQHDRWAWQVKSSARFAGSRR